MYINNYYYMHNKYEYNKNIHKIIIIQMYKKNSYKKLYNPV